MEKARSAFGTWVEAVVRGFTPKGNKLDSFVRVQPGEEFSVPVGGGSYFGSGGGWGTLMYTGIEPTHIRQICEDDNGFVVNTVEAYQFPEFGGLVFSSAGDSINDGRVFYRNAYLCATDEQIAQAVAEVEAGRKAEIEGADLEPLKAQLIHKWELMEKHHRDYHHGGCCWAGNDGAYFHAQFDTQLEWHACHEGKVSEADLAKQSPGVARALRRVAAMSEEERKAFWAAAEAAREAKKKEARRAFARGQFQQLVAEGLSERTASEVMHAAGPGRVMAALEWARYALSTIGSADALDCLLSGVGGTNGFGKGRMEAALRAFGLEPPSGCSSRALFAILAGAKAAIMGGLSLPEQGAKIEEISETTRW